MPAHPRRRAATAARARPSAATSPGWPSSPRAGPRCIAGPPGPLPAATALTTRLLVRQRAGRPSTPASIRRRGSPPTRPSPSPPSRRATATSSTSSRRLPAHRVAVTRCASRVGWTGDGAQRPRGRARSASAPPACAAAGRPLATGAGACRPSGSAGSPCRCRRSSRASTRSASTPTTWSWGRSRPDARRGLAAALGGQHQARHRAAPRGRPARRVLLPARGPLPRRLAAALPARAEPDFLASATCRCAASTCACSWGRTCASRGASLYAEVFCPEVPVYGPALIGDRPLQSRPQAAPRAAPSSPARYRGPPNRRPRGVQRARASTLRRPTRRNRGLRGGAPRLARRAGRAGRHALAILLTDAAHRRRRCRSTTSKALSLELTALARSARCASRCPPAPSFRARIKAYVIADVFPLGSRQL